MGVVVVVIIKRTAEKEELLQSHGHTRGGAT